jgi:hypothetical protein
MTRANAIASFLPLIPGINGKNSVMEFSLIVV